MPAARMLTGAALDARDRLRGEKRPWCVPPSRLMFVGGREFLGIGREFAGLFMSHGGLQPSDDVLDVGCGIGRMAVPLLDFLEPEARYEGFDVVAEGIDWCRREITPRHPNFRFQRADLRNERYNTAGGSPAAGFRFPYGDGSFDFVVSTSVFTHLRPDEVRNYLAESHRVLRPGGRVFGTWFLLGAERPRAATSEGDERAWFPHELDRARVVSPRVPEFSAGFGEARIREWHEEAGFASAEVLHGSWLGAEGPTWQDIVVAAKPG